MDLVKLSKLGGSTTIALSKVIQKNKLPWKQGDWITIKTISKNELVLKKISPENPEWN